MTEITPPRILAVIPAYREENRVGRVVRGLREQGIDVLVVDDCSPDGTGAEARQAGAHVMRLPINLGYGGALQTGYRYACRQGYEAVVQLDADGQHDPADALRLIEPVLSGECDVVVGSRFLEPEHYRMPFARTIGRKLFKSLAWVFTGRSFSDPTSGYQGLSGRVACLFCTEVFPEDYPDADMLVMLHRRGFRIQEKAVRMYSNEEQSMHSGVIKPLFYVFKMTLALFMAVLRDMRPRRGEP
ncbi:MAG: glycosyltransferase family 2 protein [Pseudomonadota bacterium]